MTTRLPTALLPPSLARLAEYCGDETMWLVWEHYGGGHVRVPKTLPPEHHLVQTLGLARASALCATYGGEMLLIPSAHAARLAVRNAAIRASWASGDTQHALARRFGLTERQIVSICGQRPPPSTQDLFEAYAVMPYPTRCATG